VATLAPTGERVLLQRPANGMVPIPLGPVSGAHTEEFHGNHTVVALYRPLRLVRQISALEPRQDGCIAPSIPFRFRFLITCPPSLPQPLFDTRCPRSMLFWRVKRARRSASTYRMTIALVSPPRASSAHITLWLLCRDYTPVTLP